MDSIEEIRKYVIKSQKVFQVFNINNIFIYLNFNNLCLLFTYFIG
jgi:hypothetical protein